MGTYIYIKFSKIIILLYYRFESYFELAQFQTGKIINLLVFINLFNINLQSFYCNKEELWGMHNYIKSKNQGYEIFCGERVNICALKTVKPKIFYEK